MKHDVIVMDVDQVLLDYVNRILEYAMDAGVQVEGFPMSWDLSANMSINSEQARKMVAAFSATKAFGTLDALPGADVILTRLYKEGFKLIFVTACGDAENVRVLRDVNMFHRFGDIFTEHHYVPVGGSKEEILEDLNERYNVVAFIDDNPIHLDEASSAGIPNKILMKAPHNRDYRDDYPSAHTWYDVYALLRDML